MGNPSEDCYEAAMEVLLYCGKTRDLTLKFGPGDTRYRNIFGKSADIEAIDTNSGLHAFSDSSWGVPFPVAGYVVMMAGGVISWSSRMLKIVAHSSCEAEYAAGSLAAKELKFIRGLCEDMGFPVHGGIVVGIDNTAAIDTAKDAGVTKRNKHFDREIHALREETSYLRTLLSFLPTHLQMADIFTKGLDKKQFLYIRQYLFRM
jgi:hypothetical protein